MTKRLVIIDGKSVFYRGYYAMPNLSTADGTPTGGVYGFASLSLEMIKKLKPDYVCVAWDKPKTNIRKRLEIYPGYKSGRKPAPNDFYAQIPILHKLLEAFNWPLYEFDDYEADDIMATLARKASHKGIETYLITSDLDALQAIDSMTHVYALKKGLTKIDLFDPKTFTEKYGIRVDQFLDLKSLKGDSSDNIPGVPGIGEKTAIQLLSQFNTLENIYENLDQIRDSISNKLKDGRESAFMSKKVAELWFDAPVELDLDSMDINKLDTEKLRNLLTKLEFRSLLKNLPENMRDTNISKDFLPSKEVSEESIVKTLSKTKELVVWFENESTWVSVKKDETAKISIDNLLAILPNAKIIGYNLKPFLKYLLKHNIKSLPEIHYDIAQGSFLLNPLQKARTLSDLACVESIDNPKVAINIVWQLYNNQSKELEKFPKIADIAHKIDFPLIRVLARMEHNGIHLDVSKLKETDSILTKKISDISAQIFDIVGYEFNISSPAQLADVLFVKLQLPTSGIKKGKHYSTGQKELDKLKGKHPIIELIEQYRELTKLQNTYTQTLPQQIDNKGYIHTTFNQDVVATGRLSSTDPNLQNIPIRTENGRQIRNAFTPEKGNVFINADYSQFELRLVAILANDENMIQDFNNDIDIHAKTASEIYDIPIKEVTSEQRRRAKVINFGVLYGMSQHGLAVAANMSRSEAQHFIDEYFRVRPNIKTYMENIIKKAHNEGFVETLFGRRRWTPDVKSNNFIVRSSAERAAANMPIQGTEADLMKLAMIKVQDNLDKHFPNAKQIIQVHDSIMLECPQSDVDNVSSMLRDTMENIHPKLKVHLKVDVKIGNNWGEV